MVPSLQIILGPNVTATWVVIFTHPPDRCVGEHLESVRAANLRLFIHKWLRNRWQ